MESLTNKILQLFDSHKINKILKISKNVESPKIIDLLILLGLQSNKSPSDELTGKLTKLYTLFNDRDYNIIDSNISGFPVHYITNNFWLGIYYFLKSKLDRIQNKPDISIANRATELLKPLSMYFFIQALRNLAEHYQLLNNYEEYNHFIEEALFLSKKFNFNKEFLYSSITYSFFLRKKGKLEESLKIIKQAEKIETSNENKSYLFHQKGENLLEIGKLNRAEKAFKQAVKYGEVSEIQSLPYIFLSFSEVYTKLGKYTLAQEQLKKSRYWSNKHELTDAIALSKYKEALILQRTGEFAQSNQLLSETIDHYSTHNRLSEVSLSQVTYAENYISMGHYDKALRIYLQLLTTESNIESKLYYLLNVIYASLLLSNLETTLEFFDQATSLIGKNDNIVYNIRYKLLEVEILRQKTEIVKAHEILSLIKRNFPDDIQKSQLHNIHEQTALLYLTQRDYETAYKFFQKSLINTTKGNVYQRMRLLVKLIEISLILGKKDNVEIFSDELISMKKNYPKNNHLNLKIKYCQALIYKYNSRPSIKLKARELLEECRELKKLNNELYFNTNFHLAELLIEEYEISPESSRSEVVDDLHIVVTELYNHAIEIKSTTHIVESLILLAKLYLIKNQTEEAESILGDALNLCIENNITSFQSEIEDILSIISSHDLDQLYTMGNLKQDIVNQITLSMIQSQASNPMYQKIRNQQRYSVLGESFSAISHDMNNILTIINLNSQYIQSLSTSDKLDPQQVSKASEIILSSTKNMSDLLIGIRNIVKDEGTHRVEISSVMNTHFKMLQSVLPKIISMQFINNLIDEKYVEINQSKLLNILLNLVMNSRDAMSDGGDLFVELSELDNKIVINILDTGTGIDERTLEKIFEPYYSTKDEGTGLGLSNVKKMMDEMNGKIEITSQVGEGTSVRLYFPILDNKQIDGN